MNTDSPRVSVLLSVYNGAEFLRESIDSVLAQSMRDFELLVIDDGSSDQSREIVASYSDPRIVRIASHKRCGLYPNLNRMAELAQAPLLKPWAQDDVMQPDCLGNALAFHEGHPNVVAFYCLAAQIWEGQGELMLVSDPNTPDELTPAMADWYLLVHGSLCGNVSTLYFPAREFAAMGGFRDHISADFGALVDAAGLGPIGRLPSPDVVVRHHQKQWSRKRSSALRTVVDNVPLFRELLRRFAARSGKFAQAAPRVLAEAMGRHATPRLVHGVLLGQWRETLDAWRAVTELVPTRKLAWYFMMRLLGRPRWLP